MLVVDQAVLGDPQRLAAVERRKQVMAMMPFSLDAVARLAARLLRTSMASVTLVGQDKEFCTGMFGLEEQLGGHRQRSLEYSVCKYVVCADHVTSSGDMLAGDDPELCEHLLSTQFGVRAFLSVPVRDSDDRPIGSLTVLDIEPRSWTDQDTGMLLEVEQLLNPAPSGAPSVAALDTTALVDGVQEAFFAVDATGTIVDFNRAAERLLGFSRAQVRGHRFDDMLMPGYGHHRLDTLLDRLFAVAPRDPVRRRVSLRRSDGTRLPAEAAVSVVEGGTGALACIFLTDLSERRAAEEQAEQSASFLAALLDSLAVGVAACDDTGEIILMNRELRRVQRLPETGALPPNYSENLSNFVYDATGARLPWDRTPLMRARAGEQVHGTDIITRVSGYRDRIFNITARPIVGADGTRHGAVAVSHEVTAIRRVERFRTCHLDVDRALAATASVTDATPAVLRAVARTLAWPAAELFLVDETSGALRAVGHWSSWAAEPDDFFAHTPLRGAGVTGRAWATGHPVWVPDITNTPDLGTPFEQHRVEVCRRNGISAAIAVPVRDAETVLGVLTCYASAGEDHEDMLTVLLDGVARQIGVYVALRRAKQLTRQLTRAGDDLIALVGHELRTPITSIASVVSLLAEEGSSLADDDRQMVDSVVRNASALQRMIDTLLDLAGLDGGHLPLKPRRADLTVIVGAAVRAARHGAAELGVRLHFDAPGPLPIYADPERLGQVVGDLLSNAVKYSPLGGDVRVTARDDDGILRLAVSDTGIGTPQDEHDRVFDRFFRGSNVRHHGSSGSGLGLSLARAIVRLHAGSIALTDNTPSGTTVTVALPGL